MSLSTPLDISVARAPVNGHFSSMWPLHVQCSLEHAIHRTRSSHSPRVIIDSAHSKLSGSSISPLGSMPQTHDPMEMAVPSADVSPPLACSGSSPALKCRPPFSARHTRASLISFAAASGRDSNLGVVPPKTTQSSARPKTARPASSHRRLTTGTTTQWQFLTKTPAEDEPTVTIRPRSSRPLRPRPATARQTPTTTAVSLPKPKRPATCRGPRTPQASKTGETPKKHMVVVDPRVIQEAARRETEQELYTGPLVGKSVEMRQLDLLDAKPHRSSCISNSVSLSEFHRMKAFQTRAKGDQRRAIVHYEKLLEFERDDQAALFQLAVAYEKTGRLEDAEATYTRVLPLDPANPFLHYNVGNLLMKLGRVEGAIAEYSAAIQKSGSGKCPHLAFYRQRGAAYRKNGDFEKAAQDYARVHAVYHRRASSTSNNADLGTAQRSTTFNATVDHPVDEVADDDYSAEQMYSTRKFANRTESSEHTASPLQELNYRRAMTIAAKPPHTRSDEELWLLSDELARHFPSCAVLHPDARKYLSGRIFSGARLPRGAMLLQEGTSGGEFIFLIARGQVSVYKKFAPRVVLSFHQNQEEECVEKSKSLVNETTSAAVSWEVLRATIFDDPIHSDDEKEEVFQSIVRKFPVLNLESWSGGRERRQVLLTHLKQGDVCGLQGRFSQQERMYTAVVSEQCDVFAVSWADFQEAERLHRVASSTQTARFLSTVPLLHGIQHDELMVLSRMAKSWKVVGERVLCSEGQFVNGLIIVREGQLCQLHPSELRRPPDLSVAFSLSGSISMSDADTEHGGLHFFRQLEYSDDPLLFLHDSGLKHGFLAHDYLPNLLAKLSKPQSEYHIDDPEKSRDPDSIEVSATSLPQGATSLCRGAFFSASSSWIPPRKSRVEELSSAASNGVACAKSALISTESTDILFFASDELKSGLSLESREKLQKNMQQITARRSQGQVAPLPSTHGLSNLRRLVFLKPPSGDDLVRKFLHETDWNNYKQELVKSIVEDNQARRPHLAIHGNGNRRPATARSSWKQ